jgi:hypothetical protein
LLAEVALLSRLTLSADGRARVEEVVISRECGAQGD